MTYVPLEVADQFEDFIIKRDEQILDAVKARTRDYSTLSLLKLLYQLRGNPMTFSDLYSKSKIRMKKSFLNYLHLCIDYNFIQKKAGNAETLPEVTLLVEVALNANLSSAIAFLIQKLQNLRWGFDN